MILSFSACAGPIAHPSASAIKESTSRRIDVPQPVVSSPLATGLFEVG
jgi:hypothetical protein